MNLLQSTGLITAPAGCGKTHEIVNAAQSHSASAPLLLLTHTNAGVAALRHRIGKAGASSSARISTIDGWAIRLLSCFPRKSGHESSVLTQPNYPKIRAHALALLIGGHLDRIIQSSYSRVIVDEYQDCSEQQHAIVKRLSELRPTVVLGDPLQAIFGFGRDDPLADWKGTICKAFEPVGELEVPWRWKNAGADELGEWLLDARRILLAGGRVDIRDGPKAVEWVELDGKEDEQKQVSAARRSTESATALIIGDSTSPLSQQQFALKVPGAITVEAVDLRDLTRFAASFDPNHPAAAQQLIGFSAMVMNLDSIRDLMKRCDELAHGAEPAASSAVETSLHAFLSDASFLAASNVLAAMSRRPGARVHRPTVLHAAIRTLRLCHHDNEMTLAEAAHEIREQYRFGGRPLPKRAVGSTLLLKGLEADAAVVLHGDKLDCRNLYVAMTRGSRLLKVCSRSPTLGQ